MGRHDLRRRLSLPGRHRVAAGDAAIAEWRQLPGKLNSSTKGPSAAGPPPVPRSDLSLNEYDDVGAERIRQPARPLDDPEGRDIYWDCGPNNLGMLWRIHRHRRDRIQYLASRPGAGIPSLAGSNGTSPTRYERAQLLPRPMPVAGTVPDGAYLKPSRSSGGEMITFLPHHPCRHTMETVRPPAHHPVEIRLNRRTE